eukprot:TRINITY_DN3845_c0_g1_i3.p1 TRINITY_DN3845_c0_g1~~TRINITY_DN3845_c0_g1_i3.p1  ORF type:complete len:203 (+),score=44.07 TRINITY_DN3845_c0_g1_i3:442-1050(+)
MANPPESQELAHSPKTTDEGEKLHSSISQQINHIVASDIPRPSSVIPGVANQNDSSTEHGTSLLYPAEQQIETTIKQEDGTGSGTTAPQGSNHAHDLDDDAAAKIHALVRAQLARKTSRSSHEFPQHQQKSVSRKSSSPSLRSREHNTGLLSSRPGSGVASPLLIPNSPSFVALKRHGTGTSLTNDSYLNSEVASASEESLA